MKSMSISIMDSMPGVFIGDPCNILGEHEYYDIWERKYHFANGIIKDDEGNVIMVVHDTFEGDGIYDILYTGNNENAIQLGSDCPVDSGTIAIVNLAFADPEELKTAKGNSDYNVLIESPVKKIDVLVDETCKFTFDVYANNGHHAVTIDTTPPKPQADKEESYYNNWMDQMQDDFWNEEEEEENPYDEEF